MGILTGLNAEEIGGLSATRIKALTMADIAGMTAEQLPGLTASQTALFSPLQLLALNKTQIPHLSPEAVAGFSPGQLAMLAPLATFTPEQIATLRIPQLAVLGSTQPAALTVLTAQIEASIPQIANLTPAPMLGGDSVLPAITLPPIELPPAPEPPVVEPPAIEPVALEIPLPTPPAPEPTAPEPSTIEIPASTPPAPVIEPPAPPAPTPPEPVIEAPTPPAPTPPPAPAAETPPANPAPQPILAATPEANDNPAPAAMTTAQIAALTADQINALSPAQLAALGLDYDKMLAILQANATGGVTAGEFSALQALAAKLNVTDGIPVSAYLEQITENVILGDPANANWTGGMKTSSPLGNLAAGSSEMQMGNLIGKWFLGTDLPSSKVRIDIAPNFNVTHVVDPSPLYADGVSMWDINQGNLGDCFLLAPLAAVAARNPSAIESMITDNGNGSYGVCFVVGGKDEYVTVNDQLANGGDIFNRGADDWGGLLEKAYAQLQAGGNVTGNPTGFGNSYTNLANGGSPEAALAAITGASVIIDYVADGGSWKSYAFDADSLTVPNGGNTGKVLSTDSGISNDELFARLAADIAAGDYLVLSSNKDAKNASGKTTLVEDHAMAICDVDTATGMLEVYNPWGTAASGIQPWETTFEVSLSKLLADGDIISVATNRVDAGGLATPSSGMFRPSTSTLGTSPSMLGLAGVA